VRFEVVPDHHIIGGPEFRRHHRLGVPRMIGVSVNAPKAEGAIMPARRKSQMRVTKSQWPGVGELTRWPHRARA
jgi:hypothetical protein